MSEYTLKDALTAANPSNISDALRMVDLGRLLQPVELFVPGVATQTITLDPAPLSAAVISARVTAGNDPGVYVCTTVGGGQVAPIGGVGVAVLTDSNTITFPSEVNDVVLSYIAAPKTPLDTEFAGTGIK